MRKDTKRTTNIKLGLEEVAITIDKDLNFQLYIPKLADEDQLEDNVILLGAISWLCSDNDRLNAILNEFYKATAEEEDF